ncbi:MAG TPA: hemerythrin domain-containing protein [Polyangia bacterium]
MSLQTLMQAGPAKVNDLFARLAETSDGAVKTREKLFVELKAELELHTSLEQQYLFPILRRNAETRELATDAVKDNKELRTKLAELEALPKHDATFPELLKELQKAFRQHARDEKRELLPAVQRALSDEQVQSVAEKIEAGIAEAEQARHDEVETRRAKARQEREQTERQAEQDAAERPQQAAVEASTGALTKGGDAAENMVEVTTDVLTKSANAAEKIVKDKTAALTESGHAAEKIFKENTAALTESGSAVGDAFQELAKAYRELASKNARNLTAGIQAISAVKNLSEFVQLEQRLIEDGVQETVSDSENIVRLTAAVFSAAFDPVKKRIEAIQKPK